MNIREDFVMFGIILISIVGLYLYYQNSSITGLTIYGDHEKVWYFNNSNEYDFDDGINFSNCEIKLNANIESTFWISENLTQNSAIQANYNDKNELSLINSEDDNWLTVNKNKNLDVIFDKNLKNGDIIELYLSGNKDVNIFLCNFSSSCISPGYGLVSYDKTKGYYNITINNLKEDTNSLSIIYTETFKIDYITAYNQEIINHTETNIIYANKGSIETEDFGSENLYLIGLFNADEELNLQGINYSYSIDQSLNWNDIQNGDNLSLFNTSSIRFRAELTSDNGAESPVLRSMTLQYINSICEENWECSSWSECVSNKSIRTCVDSNNCKTENNKPLMEIDCEISTTTTTIIFDGNLSENETNTNLQEESITTIQVAQSGRGSTGGSSSTKSSESSVSIATNPENTITETKNNPNIENNVENKEVKSNAKGIQNLEQDKVITERNDISGLAIKQWDKRDSFISLIIILGIGIYFVYKKINIKSKKITYCKKIR